MAHMRLDMTEKMRGWSVETRDAGTCFVPGHVASVPDYLKTGVTIAIDDAGADAVAHELASALADYVEGRDFVSLKVVEGYFGRYSAPGYLDRTDWNFGRNARELARDLRDTYEGD